MRVGEVDEAFVGWGARAGVSFFFGKSGWVGDLGLIKWGGGGTHVGSGYPRRTLLLLLWSVL